MAYIQYDPNKPGDLQLQSVKYLVNFVSFWGSIGSVIYYICSLVSLFKGNYSKDFLCSVGLLVLMSFIDFLVVFSKDNGESKAQAAKSYFLFFIGGTADLSAIIGIIVAVSSLCNGRKGTPLLIYSIIGFLAVTLLVVILYRKIEGYKPIKLFADKEILSEIKNESISGSKISQSTVIKTDAIVPSNDNKNYFYCHKCGKKLPDDSEYCSSCGTKLK